MKKLISIVLAFALCFSLVACGGGTEGTEDTGNAGNTTNTESNVVSGNSTPELVYPFGIKNRPMKVGVTYPYKTLCYDDTTMETNGFVTVTSYTVTPATEDGYVDKTLVARFVFNDYFAQRFGMSSRVLFTDFGPGASEEFFTSDGDWEVEINGKKCNISVLMDMFNPMGWEDGVFVSEYTLSLRMPEGYDGVALFFYNAKNVILLEQDMGVVPDGTPLQSLFDEDTQWFIIGSEDQKYYGQDYDKQTSDIVEKDLFPAEGENYDQPPVDDTYPPENTVNDHFNGESPAIITDCNTEEIDGSLDYQCVNFFYEADPDGTDNYLVYFVRDGVNGETTSTYEFPVKGGGSFSVDVEPTKLTSDVVEIAIQVRSEKGMFYREYKYYLPVK